ncbi:MAG TPA: hypothetical protein VGG33_07180, partial [Polyangia bacterium]
MKSFPRHHPIRRPLGFAVGLILAIESTAWAAPSAARDFPDRFASFRARPQTVAQVTPPSQAGPASPPATTTPSSPGAQEPVPTAPPPLPAGAPAPTQPPPVLLLNAPANESVTEKWWFWAAIGGVVVL